MIEIAISLAIIGFALVAIVGILPIGMSAQRDNRHETIINQDASVLMDALRNGERGLGRSHQLRRRHYQLFLEFQCARAFLARLLCWAIPSRCKPRWPAVATA
jgi:hypothetical protein